MADKVKDFIDQLADAIPAKQYGDAIDILKLTKNQIIDSSILFYLPSQFQIFQYVYKDSRFLSQFCEMVEKFRFLVIGLVGMETETTTFENEIKTLKNLHLRTSNLRNIDLQLVQYSIEMQYKLAQSLVNYVVDQFPVDKRYARWDDTFPTVQAVSETNLDLYQCNNPKFNSCCFLSNVVLGLFDAFSKRQFIKTEQNLIKEMPNI